MPTKGTPPLMIRLNADERARAERMRERHGLPSLAAAYRYAMVRLEEATPEKKSKKFQKPA